MSIGYKPIMGRVLIKRDKFKGEVKKESGIVIPIDAKIEKDGRLTTYNEKKLNTGVIIALGENVDHPEIKVGVRVHWGKHAGADIQPDYLHDGKVDGEEYFICMEEDILGVFEGANETGEKE